jgi:GH15 family glucan-1,4-alpha-glucosidase
LDDDGLPGKEGGMLICTGWLIQSLALIGERRRAEALFDQFVSLVGPTGIATEQYCPRYNIALGNLAQGYTHLAIIDAAVALAAPLAS